MVKKSSNPFKQAAERQRKSPGGEVKPQAEENAAVKVEVDAPAEVKVEAAPVVETAAAEVVEVKAQEEKAGAVDLMARYKEQAKAPKKVEKVRKQFVIPKSIDDKLKKAMKNKEISSENQLVNDLLKNFFDGKLLYKED